MRYQHRFRVRAPLAAVARFHMHSATMAAITPPPIVTQIHQAPDQLSSGDGMEFTLWFGLLPIRWQVRFEDVSDTGFVDRQVRGPMRRWQHRHTFVPVDETTTDVVDEIEIELRRHPFWWPVGLGVVASLPVLFAYRARKTRRLLAERDELTSPTGPRSKVALWALVGLAGLAVALAYAGWRSLAGSKSPGIEN